MNPDLGLVCRLLEQEPLRNLVTLKMLNSHGKSMSFQLDEGADGWALLSLLPVSDSAWDRTTYPMCKYVAFINGTSASRKVQLLSRLPRENVVLKTAEEAVQNAIAKNAAARKAMVFHSFTTGKQFGTVEADPRVRQSGRYNENAWRMFRANGYEDEELERYFEKGAQWFGLESGGQLASACFVFQNYGRIWEIGGVYTQPELRRRGLGKLVVMGALRHLSGCALIPRYQTRGDNHASLLLAKSCRLEEFLQMMHYVLLTEL